MSSAVANDLDPRDAELQRLRAESARLRVENAHLRRENEQLRSRSSPGANAGVPAPAPPPDPISNDLITRHSSSADKIIFFRRLFRGRDNVHAVRWENPDGRTGYAPAALSRWHREHDQLLPLTEHVVQDHLLGKQTVGIYPLLRDETCWFLTADFDKQHWQEDVTTYLQACDELGVPTALERSRSGNGGHVWIFFDAPVPAAQARKLGCFLLSRAIEQRHQIGLDSYDRLFPNQDTLPKGGFGNLIALPLQRGPLRQGNSAFVDRGFAPYPDQWAFLSSVRRVTPVDLTSLLARATRLGDVIGVRSSQVDADGGDDPWTLPPSGRPLEKIIAGPFPASIRLTLANLVYIAKEGLPPALLSRLWRLAAFQNPEFYHAQALRLSTFGKPRVISCGEEFERHLGLPRGCLDDVLALLEAHGIRVDVADERVPGTSIDVAFHGELAPIQRKAANAVLAQDIGVLCAPTAFGKTVVAASLIAIRRVNTLVLVHRRHLLDQWRARLAAFLDLPSTAIGQVGGGKRELTGQIDVALIQSLSRREGVDDIVAQYGHVIVDECHHIPAFSFERVLKAAKARCIVGLTATPIRKDGHHPIVLMQCGPLRFRVSPKDEAVARPFEQVVIPRPTGFQLSEGVAGSGIQAVYAALAADEHRNALICADLLKILEEGRTPLLLTERATHLDELARRLDGRVRHLVILRGGMGARQRRAVAAQLEAIPDGKPCALLATGRYAGEGFDHARLDTLLLALPISWRGTVQQYVGRLNRLHPDKCEVRIYDYLDAAVPVLARMYDKRQRGYRALGYVIQSTDDNELRAEISRSRSIKAHQLKLA